MSVFFSQQLKTFNYPKSPLPRITTDFLPTDVGKIVAVCTDILDPRYNTAIIYDEPIGDPNNPIGYPIILGALLAWIDNEVIVDTSNIIQIKTTNIVDLSAYPFWEAFPGPDGTVVCYRSDNVLKPILSNIGMVLNSALANETIYVSNITRLQFSGGGGGGNIVTAGNGLDFTGGNPNNITLGGALTNNTDISTLDFRFKVEGTDSVFGFNQGLSINANINQAQLFSTTQNSLIGWDNTLNKLMIQSGSLENVTITNDGTNNIILAPSGLRLNHDTYFDIQYNNGVQYSSYIYMDDSGLGLQYGDSSTGWQTQQSHNAGSWGVNCYNDNVGNISINTAVQMLLLDQATQTIGSKITADIDKVTIEKTDGATITSKLTVGEEFGIKGIYATHADNLLQSQIIMDNTRSQFSYSNGSDIAAILAQPNNTLMQVLSGLNTSTISIDGNLGTEAITISSSIAELYINIAQTNSQLPYSVLTLIDPNTGLTGYTPGYQKVEHFLSPAVLFDISNTPFELLPAPTTGYYYDIDKILLEYTYNVAPYILANPLDIRIGGTATNTFRLINRISNGVLVLNDIYLNNATGDYLTASLTDDITLSSDTNPTGVGSNGTLRVVIWYREVGFGF